MKHNTRTTGIQSKDAFFQTLDDIADLTSQLAKHQAKLDKAILAAREEYGPKVEEINNIISAKMSLCEAFAIRNRESLMPGNLKSADSIKAVFGFRLGNPTLVLLNKKHSWKTVCTKLMEEGLDAYLKQADPKPDKDRIKADFDDSRLATLGLRIQQDEAFWVEPKNDTCERLQ